MQTGLRGIAVHLKRGTTVMQVGGFDTLGSHAILPYGDDAAMPIIDRTAASTGRYGFGGGTTEDDTIYIGAVHLYDGTGTVTQLGVLLTDVNRAALQAVGTKITGFWNSIHIDNGDGHIIDSCDISEFRNNGVLAEYLSLRAGRGLQITNNFVDGRGASGVPALNDCVTLHSGEDGGSDCFIGYNTIIAGEEQCIDVAVAGFSGATIEGNICYSREDGASSSWSDITVGTDAHDCTVRGNLLFSRGYRFGIDASGYDNDIYDNVIVQRDGVAGSSSAGLMRSRGLRNKFRNNHVQGGDSFIGYLAGISPGDYSGELDGNLMYLTSAAGSILKTGLTTLGPGSTSDNNEFYGGVGSNAAPFPGSVNFAAWQATVGSPDAHSTFTAGAPAYAFPSFRAVGDRDYDTRALLVTA